jgi:tetratricopeptide (TPR) repeat protein
MIFFEGSKILVLLINEDANLEAVQEVIKDIEWAALNNLIGIVETTDNSIRLEKLSEYLTKFPPSTYYYCLKASTHRNLKQFEEAKRDYLNSLAFDENNVEALNGLGFLYDKQFDNKDAAKSCYEKALTTEPKQNIVRLNLGTLLDDKFKDKEAAKNQYEIILSYDSNEYRAHNNLGNYYSRATGDTNRQKIIFHYEKAIEINPLYFDAYFNYGCFLQEINQREKSRLMLQKAKSLLKEGNQYLTLIDLLMAKSYK